MTKLAGLMTGLMSLAMVGIASDAAAAPRAINACGTISTPGSYILPRNINGTAAAGDCIVVDSPHVTIDMSGFGIGGPGLVGGVAGGHGIKVLNGNDDVTIRNGFVTGFISGIVFDVLTSGGIVEGVILRGNVASGNTNHGILARSGAVIIENLTFDNGAGGLQADCDSVVIGNTSFNNGGSELSISNRVNNVNCAVVNNSPD